MAQRRSATEQGQAAGAAWPAGGVLLLVTLWLVWGTSWPAMRIVFLEMPIWQFRAISAAIGGVALLGIGMAVGDGWRVPKHQWAMLIAAAVFNITIWHIAVGYGLFFMGAGHAVILCYTLPIWTAVLSVTFLKERLSGRKIGSLILGILGIAVLLSSDFDALGTNPIGAAFVLAAAVGWAIGTIVVKRVAWTVNMFALAGWQLLIGLIPIAIVALLTEPFTLHKASSDAILASLYVVFVAIIAGYALWFRIVQIFPATVASIGSLVIPVIGMMSAAVVLGEPLNWREGAAMILVLGAVALVVFQPKRSSAR